MGGRHGIKPVNRTSKLAGLNASLVPISGGRLRGSYVKRVGVAPPTGRAGIPADFWRRGVLCLLYNELTNGHLVLSKEVVMSELQKFRAKQAKRALANARNKANRKARKEAQRIQSAKPKLERHPTERELFRRLDSWQ